MTADDQRIQESLPAYPRTASEDTTGDLGQAIVGSLFQAGLDMNYVLMTLGEDGPTSARLARAVDAVDQAIVNLRHLILALPDKPPLLQDPGSPPSNSH